ncbi:MAG: hypothetical protein GY853_10130 [PVC group bacterium]|nr:hypothetical protein [PVC group bacterium]
MQNYRSGTETHHGNEPQICRRCGEYLQYCVCHLYIDEPNMEAFDIKVKTVKPFQNHNTPVNIVRRTPTSISGMKGIKLLKRMDK